MAKYSKKALRRMAKQLVRFKREGDPRYLEFVITVSLRSGKSAEDVERYIILMDKGITS